MKTIPRHAYAVLLINSAVNRLIKDVPPDSSSPCVFSLSTNQQVKYSRYEVTKNVLIMAGINGDFSNYSLRATSATQMFDMGYLKRLFKERTGHKSWDAVRTIERYATSSSSQLLTSSSSSNTTDQLLPTTQFFHSSLN